MANRRARRSMSPWTKVGRIRVAVALGRTGGVVAAGAACCIATAGRAQIIGGAPYYAASLEHAFVDPGVTLTGNPDLAGDFTRTGNVSVTSRPHPEYAPLGIRAGSYVIYPSVDARARYDSNIFAQERATKSDVIADTTLHVEADSTWSQNVLNLFGDLRRRGYASNGRESNTTFRLGADGRLLVDRLTPVTATITYQHQVEPRTAVTGDLSSRSPIRYDSMEAVGQVTHEFNRLVARATVRYADLDYRNAQDVAGRPLPQDYRDHHEFRARGELDYAVSPSLAPFVAAEYDNFAYNLAKQIVPVDRDSHGYELMAGVDVNLSRLARGRIQVGYLHQEFENPAIRPISTPSVRARIEYTLSPLITLSALASRRLYDSQLREAPSYLDTSAVVRADYEMFRDVIITTEAGYELANFKGLDRNDRRRTFDIGGTYLINRHFTLRAQYVHLEQHSHGMQASTDYDDDVGYLGLAVAI